MRPGPGPPDDEGDRVLPSVELIDLTGLSTDDEHDDGANDDQDASGGWEDVSDVIDLTNLPSDDEANAAVEIVKADRVPTAPALHRHRHRHQTQPSRNEICELCNRVARYDRGITKHHLYPQSVVKAAPPNTYTPEQKTSLARLCWPCHSAIHRIMTNTVLATSFHSVELLKGHVEVQAWINKMQRATTAELDVERGRRRTEPMSVRASRRRARLLQKTPAQRPLPSQRPDEDLSRFSGLRRSARLAGLDTGTSGKISRVGAFSASQVCGVKKPRKSKAEKRLARELRRAAMLSKIKQALDTLWAQNGNSFPRDFPGMTRNDVKLRNVVRKMTSEHQVQLHDVRSVLLSRPEYREWFDWAFLSKPPAAGQETRDLMANSLQTPHIPDETGGTQDMQDIQPQTDENMDGGVLVIQAQDIQDIQPQNDENMDRGVPVIQAQDIQDIQPQNDENMDGGVPVIQAQDMQDIQPQTDENMDGGVSVIQAQDMMEDLQFQLDENRDGGGPDLQI